MEFNQLVISQLEPIFREQGFQVAEQFKNFVRFKSDFVEATVSHNELDKSSLFEIGKRNEFLYPINDNVIKQVFNSDLSTGQK